MSLNRHALIAQWIEHLTTDQKVGGSSPFERAEAPHWSTRSRCGVFANLSFKAAKLAHQLGSTDQTVPSTSTRPSALPSM